MSSAAGEVRIVYAFLEALHSNVRTAADMFEDCEALSRLGFSPNHEVTDAYGEYVDDWSGHRESLQQGLDAVAGACQAILGSFKDAEGELINALRSQTG